MTIVDLKELFTCEAKTRSGKPCKNWRGTTYCPTTGNWRCKNDGRYSTGPRTPEGKARSRLNLRQFAAKARQGEEKPKPMT